MTMTSTIIMHRQHAQVDQVSGESPERAGERMHDDDSFGGHEPDDAIQRLVGLLGEKTRHRPFRAPSRP